MSYERELKAIVNAATSRDEVGLESALVKLQARHGEELAVQVFAECLSLIDAVSFSWLQDWDFLPSHFKRQTEIKSMDEVCAFLAWSGLTPGVDFSRRSDDGDPQLILSLRAQAVMIDHLPVEHRAQTLKEMGW